MAQSNYSALEDWERLHQGTGGAENKNEWRSRK